MLQDIEKQRHVSVENASTDSASNPGTAPGEKSLPPRPDLIDPTDPGEVKISEIRNRWAVLRRLHDADTWLDRRMKYEAMGVERIPENKRRPPQILNMMLFWFSLLLSPVLVPIGMLGPTFGLSVYTSIVLSICATLCGTVVPAFTATLCPATGLRQIAVARYSMGVWGSKLCGLLNIVVNVGYGVISSVVGGQLIAAVSGETVPLAVGIIILVILGFAISFLGFGVIHMYERYAWIFALILICVTWGQASALFSPTPGLNGVTGLDYTGSCLSYFAIIFGVACSWCSIAGDYYVHYPADTSKYLVFCLTFLGQSLPTIFVSLLGNYFGGIIMSNDDLSQTYEAGGVGALFLAVLHPAGWAKAACVFFLLTFLGNLVANIYSAALSIQLWGRHFIAVPRSLWCLLLTIIILALALGGRDQLEEILNNLLSILGYWTLAFGGILFLENFIFRPRLGGYDLTAWQDVRRMPWGVAGTGTLLIGIGISFVGMNQTWYRSPLANLIGMYGGDVGDYLVFATTLLFYPILRTIEIRLSGR